MNEFEQQLAPLVTFYQTLTQESVAQFPDFYSADAWFKDPFNEVRGLPAIQRIFDHMFVALDAPRFEIRDVVAAGDQCFLTWDFVFRMKRWRRDEQRIHGGSHLRFAADGRSRSAS